MNALILVLFCEAASLGAGNTGFRLGLGTQFLGGYTASPVVLGPDSSPLLNVQSLATAQWEYDLILSPAVSFITRQRGISLELAYTPRIYLDLTQVSATPTVFNIASARLIAGKPTTYLLTLTPTLSLGGIGATGLGALSTATSPATVAAKPGTTDTANGSYASASVTTRLDHPLNRDWVWNSIAVANILLTPDLESDTSGTINADSGLVQSVTRGNWLNEFHYRINSDNFIIYAVDLGWVDFTVESYSLVTLSMAWESQLSKATKLNLRLGALEYWTGNFAREYDKRNTMAIIELGVDHTFINWGLPRMRGNASVVIGPYVDIVYGMLEPRTTVQGNIIYDFNRSWSGSLLARLYTEEYFTGKVWEPVPIGHTKYAVIPQVQLKYKAKPWLTWSAGGYTLFRWLVPSNTDPQDTEQDYFFFVRAEGAYGLE